MNKCDIQAPWVGLSKEDYEEKSAIENSIKQVLGEAAEGECNGYSVTWKNRTSNRFDTKKFQEDHADLYAAYVTQTSTRTFLFKVRK